MSLLSSRKELYVNKMIASIKYLVSTDGYCDELPNCYSCILYDKKCDNILISKRPAAAISAGIEKGYLTDTDVFDMKL